MFIDFFYFNTPFAPNRSIVEIIPVCNDVIFVYLCLVYFKQWLKQIFFRKTWCMFIVHILKIFFTWNIRHCQSTTQICQFFYHFYFWKYKMLPKRFNSFRRLKIPNGRDQTHIDIFYQVNYLTINVSLLITHQLFMVK